MAQAGSTAASAAMEATVPRVARADCAAEGRREGMVAKRGGAVGLAAGKEDPEAREAYWGVGTVAVATAGTAVATAAAATEAEMEVE